MIKWKDGINSKGYKEEMVHFKCHDEIENLKRKRKNIFLGFTSSAMVNPICFLCIDIAIGVMCNVLYLSFWM